MEARPRLRERLTYANVTATLAMFLALTGGAVAATQLAKNSVGPMQLKKNAVNRAKVADASLTGADIRDLSITGPEIADGAISPAKLSAPSPSGPSLTTMSLTEDCTSATGPLPAGVSVQEQTFGCRIDFGRNVLNCAASATVHFRTNALVLLTERAAQIGMSPGEPNIMGVSTSENGSNDDLPFDLILVC
jgi:hypothetical protein